MRLQNESTRHAAILEIAARDGAVQVNPLAQTLDVSVQTIRHDLRVLDQRGQLERTHGGAILPSGVRHIQYIERRNLHRAIKDRIAAKAASLIPNDASLFLNIGTTTEAVAKHLAQHKNLMVVTNNLNIATILAQHPSCDVTVTGGHLRQTDGALVGDIAANTVKQFKVDFAVIGASAIDTDGDLLDFDASEVRVAQTILTQARTKILVCDHSKFARTAPVRIAGIDALDHIVTDNMPENLVGLMQDADVKIWPV